MGPLERLIESFYLLKDIGEEEKGEREIFFWFQAILASFWVPQNRISVPFGFPRITL